MKVSTDACIQGAWTPVTNSVCEVLDIGAGTGLLSLMLAQRDANILIDAIELDNAAALQARYNIVASPWADRIHIKQGDVRYAAFGKKYDLIICNPPFFNNSLLGDTAARNTARHTLSLTQRDLLQVLENNLHKEGYASVMLPVAEFTEWQQLLEKNEWSMFKKLLIQPRQSNAVNRIVGLCAKNKISEVDEQLIIYNDDHSYTAAFTDLLRPFYLKL